MGFTGNQLGALAEASQVASYLAWIYSLQLVRCSSYVHKSTDPFMDQKVFYGFVHLSRRACRNSFEFYWESNEIRWEPIETQNALESQKMHKIFSTEKEKPEMSISYEKHKLTGSGTPFTTRPILSLPVLINLLIS